MILLLFFFLSFFTIDSNLIEKRPEFVNVFSSTIYPTYLNQRDAFLATHEQGLHALAADPSFEELHRLLTCKGERGAVYQTKLMLTLREALSQKNYASTAVQTFLDDYLVWLFGTADLEIPFRRFIAHSLPINFKEAIAKNRSTVFMDVHNVVMEQPNFTEDKKTGRELPPEDNFLYGDFPSYLYNLGQTEVIRTSNVMRDLTADAKGKTTSAALNPEFYQYIQALATRGEKHLYINVLSHENYEKYKSFALEAMENDPQVSPGIVVIGLDKEKTSALYYQSGPFENLNDAKEFKHILHEKLVEGNGSYYWSKHLDMQAWSATLATLIDEVHREIFHNASTLDQSSRQDFIDFTYVKIIEALTQQFQPKRLNITCKQAVDRGPTLYALLYLYKQSKHGPLQPKDIEQALYFAFAPALAFHDRATHVYRIDRLQSAANRLP